MKQEVTWLCSDCYNWTIGSMDRASSKRIKNSNFELFGIFQVLN